MSQICSPLLSMCLQSLYIPTSLSSATPQFYPLGKAFFKFSFFRDISYILRSSLNSSSFPAALNIFNTHVCTQTSILLYNYLIVSVVCVLCPKRDGLLFAFVCLSIPRETLASQKALRSEWGGWLKEIDRAGFCRLRAWSRQRHLEVSIERQVQF